MPSSRNRAAPHSRHRFPPLSPPSGKDPQACGEGCSQEQGSLKQKGAPGPGTRGSPAKGKSVEGQGYEKQGDPELRGGGASRGLDRLDEGGRGSRGEGTSEVAEVPREGDSKVEGILAVGGAGSRNVGKAPTEGSSEVQGVPVAPR